MVRAEIRKNSENQKDEPGLAKDAFFRQVLRCATMYVEIMMQSIIDDVLC